MQLKFVFDVLGQMALMPLPWKIRRWFLNASSQWNISPQARIGLSLVLTERLTMGAGSRIGDFNVIKGMELVSLGEHATIGRGNWVNGLPRHSPYFTTKQHRRSELTLDDHASVTHQHIFDCTDRISIGKFTTIAGWRSQFVTHAIDYKNNEQDCSPIQIGNYCLIGTSCVALKGSIISDCCIVAAGSIYSLTTGTMYTLYGGAPARAIKPTNQTDKYFNRQIGRV